MKNHKRHLIKDRRAEDVISIAEKEINEDFKRVVISVITIFIMLSAIFFMMETGSANQNGPTQYSKVINQKTNVVIGIEGGFVLNVVKITGSGWEYYQSNASISFTSIYRTTPYQGDFIFNTIGGISFSVNQQYVTSSHSSSFIIQQWVVVNAMQNHPIESQQNEYLITESMSGWFISSYSMSGYAFIDADYTHSFMADLNYTIGSNSFVSSSGQYLHLPTQVPYPVEE
jgi:hypothetical protein